MARFSYVLIDNDAEPPRQREPIVITARSWMEALTMIGHRVEGIREQRGNGVQLMHITDLGNVPGGEFVSCNAGWEVVEGKGEVVELNPGPEMESPTEVAKDVNEDGFMAFWPDGSKTGPFDTYLEAQNQERPKQAN